MATNLDKVKAKNGQFKKSMIALAILGLSQQAFAQEAQEEDTNTEDPSDVEVIQVKGIRGALATAADLKRESDTFMDSITATDANVLPDLSVAEALARIPGVTVTRFSSGGSNGDFPSPEGSGNLIRGLGFVRSEFNGRDAFTANGGRALDWSAVPPELIGGVDVYKNQSADLIEGGIGGSVNLRTLEPFDRDKPIVVFAADTTYTDLREEWSPSFSLVLGDRWKTDAGEFGLLGAYSSSDLKSDIHGYQAGSPNPRSNLGGEFDGQTVGVVQGFQLRTNEVDRERESFYVAGQWRSDDNNMEATFKYVRVENQASNVEQTTESFTDANSWNRIEVSDLVVRPFTSDGIAQCNGNNEDPVGSCDTLIPVDGGLMEEGLLTDSGDSWWGAYGLQVSNLGIGAQEESSTDDISVNFKWRPADQWMVELDAHRTTADAERQSLWVGSNTFLQVRSRPDLEDPRLEFFVDPRLNLNPGFIRDGGSNVVPYTLPTGSADPGAYFMPFAADEASEGTGELTALRGDVTYDFDGDGWFESVKFGARYSEREQVNKIAGLNWQGVSQAWNGGISRYNAFDNPNAYEVVDFSDFFRGGVVQGDNTSFVYVNSDFLRNHNAFFDFYLNEPDLQGRNWSPYQGRSNDGNFTPLFDDGETSDIVEKTVNLYFRLDFYHELSNGMELDGNFGVRYVKTDLDSAGSISYTALPLDEQSDPPSPIEGNDSPRDFLPETTAFMEQPAQQITADISDTHYLPSFNLKLNLDDEKLIRFGVSKAVTRPNVQDLRASQSLRAGTTTLQFPPLDPDDPDFGTNFGIRDVLLRSININGGNPDLLATTATNIDLSFEWYFEEGDFFSFALFKKDLENIITYGSEVRDTITLDGQSANYQYIGPINQDKADVQGFEVSYQEFFDELPGLWGNLGIQANYTYIDSEATPPPAFLDDDGDGQPDAGSFENILRYGLDGMLGQSADVANLIGIYQDDKFEARLAYSWRGEYLNSYRDFVTGNPVYQEKSGFLDLSLRYDYSENLQFSFQGANLLDEKSKSNVQIDEAGQRYIRSSFLNDRRFKFGVRYTY